jgi:hypothetical protein
LTFLSFSFSLDDEEDEDINLNSPLIFVNSSLNLQMNSNTPTMISDQTVSMKARLSEHSEKEYDNNRKVINHHESNPCGPKSYARLPYSLRNKNPSFNSPSQSEPIRSPMITNPPIRRQFPQFESVRTPAQNSPIANRESQSTIPSELFDCCQT